MTQGIQSDKKFLALEMCIRDSQLTDKKPLPYGEQIDRLVQEVKEADCVVEMCIRDRTRVGNNPFFVKELETGYVVIGDYQHFKGYTLFLYKTHVCLLYTS